MKMESPLLVEAEVIHGDSVRSRLPGVKKLGFWSNTFILWGMVLTVSSLLVGGLVGIQLPFGEAMIVIGLAGVFNTLLAIFIGLIGTRTGFTSAMIFRYSYGETGVMLPNFIMSITTIVWFAVILNVTRDAFVDIFALNVRANGLVYWLITLVMAVVFVLPAYKTMRWIAYVNSIAAPALIFVLITAFWGAVNAGGGFQTIVDKSPVTSASIFVVFTTAAGGWLHANTVMSDFTRFYKTERQAKWGLFLTFGVLMVFQYVGAAIGAMATGEWNFFLTMEKYGLHKITFLILFLGSWSTAMTAIYFAANLMAAPPVLEYKNEETTRKLVLIIASFLALFFSWYGPDRVFDFFLQFLAWLVGPIAITVITDFWLLPKKRQLYFQADSKPDMVVNPAAFAAWAIGFLAGYYSQAFFISILNGMFATGLVYYLWMNSALNAGTTPEKQWMKLTGKSDRSGSTYKI